MKAGKLLISLMFATVLLSAAVSAAEGNGGVDSVILTTDTNYPDTMVAAVAADMSGIPMLLTGRDQLPAETLAEIQSLNISTVYIIGGPEVVSEAVEAQLAGTYDVARIWGMTRFGTAAAVAEYFWESSDQAMLVWDRMSSPDSGNFELLSQAKDLAMQDDIPVLLIQRNGIPGDVVDALANLSVTSVILVGNLGPEVRSTLDGLGIAVSEEIKGPDENGTKEKIKEKIKQKIRSKGDRPLVVVAMGNWSDSIRAPYRPNGTSRHITSESQIDTLIAEINDNNHSRIMVVGKPALAAVVYERLTSAGIQATLVSGKPVNVAVQVMRRDLERIRERKAAIADKLRAMYRRRVLSLVNNTDALVRRAENILNNARITEEAKSRMLNALREAKQQIDEQIEAGNYTKAWMLYNNLDSRVEKLMWLYRARLVNAYQSLVQRETSLNTSLQRLEQLRNLRSSSAGAA